MISSDIMRLLCEGGDDVIPILYEDKNAVVAVKPAGMLSQPDAKTAKSAPTALTEVEKHLGSKPGTVGMITRLDAPVGGIMVFGKNPQATAKLQNALASGEIIKEYLAVASGIIAEKSGVMVDYLARENAAGLTKVAYKGAPGAKYAELRYEVLGEHDTDFGMSSLMRIRLITGRTHQIRAQLASRGLPIIGDRRYGSADSGTGAGIALYSYRVTIPRDKGGIVTLASLPCVEYPWSAFGECFPGADTIL